MLTGVVVKQLAKRADHRGWLMELFREDELPEGFMPAMAYISFTKPGVARGPHEHVHQTDGFAFLSGEYRLYLWERDSGRSMKLDVGEDNPVFVIVPPGIVHAYKNVGANEAFVVNLPDKLYAGRGRAEPVDEIRHEEDSESPYRLDD